jgi:hypothetical protein
VQDDFAELSAYCPAGQNLHDVDPAESAYFAGVHEMQDVAPLEAWYVPAEHLWQVVSPVETPYQPGAQDVHEDPVNKFDDWYWPRAQSSQLPGEIWRLPALHPLGLHAQYFWDL